MSETSSVVSSATELLAAAEDAPHGLPPHDVAPHDVAPHDVAPHDVAPHDVAPHDVAPHDVATHDNLAWVWREVRKRVFLKIPFSRPVAEALEKVVPIALDGDSFVCGLPIAYYSLSTYLAAGNVHNAIENILESAAKHRIRFDLIEGILMSDWLEVKARRNSAHDAVIAIAEQKVDAQHYEAILNQIVSEIRQRITATPERMYPQVRAALLLEIVPLLADTADMLFPDRHTHEARRAMTRAIDRVAIYLDIPALNIAIETERYFKEHTHQK